jgi:glycosyltransferase involved in cell wall biosynthesis
MKVSVITCTYNRAEQLKRGIMSIIRQYDGDNITIPLEIVVVDDGSTDNTRQVIEELILEARQRSINFNYIYLDHPEPRISCIPRNIGIKQSSGEILIFTEPEGVHVGNTIKELFEALEANPNNTILASQVWTMGEKIYKELTEDHFKHPKKILKHPYAQITSGNMQNTKAPDSDWAISGELNCNAGVLFATKKKWLLDIGGFNEEFTGHGFDDFDLFNRLALYGKGVLKVDSIPIIHLWHEKNYPYNIYEAAEFNGKISEAMIHAGQYKANVGKTWGELKQ